MNRFPTNSGKIDNVGMASNIMSTWLKNFDDFAKYFFSSSNFNIAKNISHALFLGVSSGPQSERLSDKALRRVYKILLSIDVKIISR